MKYLKFLFSPVFMGSLLVFFAVSMAIATFVENDFGAGAAYARIYNAKWFELIMLLLAVNLTAQLVIFKMFRKAKLPVALFHLAFILMILGAGITRYTGWEGSIHIREGQTSDICYSSDNFIGYTVKNDAGNLIAEFSKKYSISSGSAVSFRKDISAGNKNYQLVLARIIPNAGESITDDPSGVPIASLLITRDMMTRETVTLKKGESLIAQGISIGFDASTETDVKISLDSAAFFISSKYSMGRMSMMTQVTDTLLPGARIALKPMELLEVNDVRIVPQKMTAAGSTKAVSFDPAEQETGLNALVFHVFSGTESQSFNLWVNESEPVASATCAVEGLNFEVTYGSKITRLPFSLRLNDFILERYPGSNSPSGYKSDVVLLDNTENVEKPFSVYMNNILKYRGFRFFQSSYDRDEKGTVLSVNHDMAGMLVSYTGYLFLFIFIVLSLIIKTSQFRTVTPGSWSSALRKTASALIFIFFLSGLNNVSAQKLIPGKESSEKFGNVLVQDQKGRTKPLFTLSSDILRKVSRESNLGGFTPMQIFLGVYLDFENWKDVPIIRVSNKDLQREIGINGNLASFSNIVNISSDGSYKLSERVNAAYSKSPAERTKFDKEVMKVDERVNIVYMIYKGDFMKIFPIKDGSSNWGPPPDAIKTAVSKEDSTYLQTVTPLLYNALETNNTMTVSQISESISAYQERFAGYNLPSGAKTKVEILYYKLGIFEKLFPFYATVGLIMLIGLIIMVIRGKKKTSLVVRILGWILTLGFIFHTSGIAMRWYIAGHTPLSNGYESLIFISWVTLLAGLIFSRRSAFALSATAVLSGMTLMVAHLSFMDPEITNLVPVLKSYWLTLHVSVITGSYGFLGLGAILGIITMILLSLSNKENRERISNTIDELTVINYRTLVLGLYFLTIGTFLGAVWANESWGRYWGWDPKETWSLITIIVYSFVTHSRLIPGMKNVFMFNLLSLFGFSSVLMTYFGVNYYLSGLHSYAAGDPVPVPAFVYVAVIVMISLSGIAWFRYRRYIKGNS
jgi:cytochrome c-type biogenesis protein CcsB